MARSKQDIVNALIEAAQQDPILGEVTASLVGKELLYFGANVIYQIESATNAVSRFSDLSRADMDQLIAFGFSHEVPVATYRPATVTLTLRTASPQVFAPFTLRLAIGSAFFYNIDFVQSGRQVTFYQGIVRTIRSSSQTLDAFQLDSKGIASSFVAGSWQLYKEFLAGSYQSSYVKLGEKAIPASVRVFAKSTDSSSLAVFPYTEFQYGLTSPQAHLYKVRTGWDRSINVYFGDANWAEAVNMEQFYYQLYWLEATAQNFSVTKQASIQDLISGTTFKVSDSGPGFSISSSTLAEAESLSYARSSMEQAIFETQGLVTETQIKAYVDSFPSVNSSRLSSSVSSQGLPSVEVLVKPASPENTSFGFLQDALTQYGVDGVSYKVTAATPVSFKVRLTPIGSSGVSELPRAQQMISDFCSYQNLTLSSLVSSSVLTQYLQQQGLFNVNAEVVVSDLPVTASSAQLQLPAPPLINTIRQVSGDEVVGFDSNGVWRSLSSKGTSISTSSQTITSFVGDYIFLCTPGQKNYLVRSSGSNWVAQDVTQFLRTTAGESLSGRFIDTSDQGPAFLHTSQASGQQQLLIFPDSAAFREGPASIFNSLTVVTPIWEVTVSNSQYSIDLNASVGLYNGYLYFYKVGGTSVWRLQTLGTQVSESLTEVWTIADDSVRCFLISGQKLTILESTGNFLSSIFEVSLGTDGLRTQYSIESQGGVPSGIQSFTKTLVGFEFVSVSGVSTYFARFSNLSGRGLCYLSPQTSVNFQPWVFGSSSVTPTYVRKVAEGVYLPSVYPLVQVVSDFSSVYDLTFSRRFVSEGTVDYISGVIYGIVVEGEDDKLSYEVSGTLTGSNNYPQFSGFVEA